MKVAAIQLEPVIGGVDANLASCERLADEAGGAGAEWILLPEFFTTGMGFLPELADKSLPPDGAACDLLLRLAGRHGAKVGGSFLCRDDDGEVRNAFFLAGPSGLIGRHDKDLPTMWENCWYVGGSDDGVLAVDEMKVGVSLCLEFLRTQTVRRLRGVDLVVGGSFTWQLPGYWPRLLGREEIRRREADRMQWSPPFARFVGAPVVEAAHCGRLDSRDQLSPFRWRCALGNGAKICAADGTVIAARGHDEGPGFVIAEIEPGAVEPLDELPDRFWIQPIGAIWTGSWHLQRLLGRRWYARHGRPPAP